MTLRVVAGAAPGLVFDDPVRVWAPADFDEARDALRELDDALASGYWIAGGLSYEFGALLHDAPPRMPQTQQFVIGAFREPRTRTPGTARTFALSAPLTRITHAAYADAIDAIVESIREGDVYQVNFTVPFDLGFEGDPLALFDYLAERAQAPHAAYLEYDDLRVVSISPELFLHFDGNAVRAKPMKGTAALDRVAELQEEKNRSEHVMIVDLLRNDLNRFCSGVTVDPLFEVEIYPTFATMTSTVQGTMNGDPVRRFSTAILNAFPCGSVTGAPKRAAIARIAALEKSPRGFYTGSLGYMAPGGNGEWNVAIRTLQLRDGLARYDCGGGIVSDSSPESEWNEIAVKSRFLGPAIAHFSILETFRSGEEAMLEAHLSRMRRAARDFGVRFDEATVRRQIADAAREAGSLIRVRTFNDRVTVSSEPLGDEGAVEICFSSQRVNSADPLLRYKTAWRPAHNRASNEAAQRGCFDALLLNERGEVTEGSRTNVFARIGGTICTPPLSSGVLPGILRSRLVTHGGVVERVMTPEDLERAEAVFIGNSARGLLPARIR